MGGEVTLLRGVGGGGLAAWFEGVEVVDVFWCWSWVVPAWSRGIMYTTRLKTKMESEGMGGEDFVDCFCCPTCVHLASSAICTGGHLIQPFPLCR